MRDCVHVPSSLSTAILYRESCCLEKGESIMTLLEAEVGKTYIIKEINTDDDEMNSFLFRLGCYSGEPITVVSKKKKSCVAVIKDGRYNLDQLLSEAVII